MLDSFINLDLVDSSYKLKLSEFMHVHDVFHSDLLWSIVNDLLSDQKNEFSEFNSDKRWRWVKNRWYIEFSLISKTTAV